MVVGRSFVWAHLPKAAGDTTLAMFRLFPELVESADGHRHQRKHDYFRDRPVAGKTRVLNIRRLPHWVLSYHVHGATHGLYPTYDRVPMPSADEMAESRAPDGHLTNFADEGIDVWLRTESLADDFLAFASTLTDVTERRRRAVRKTKAENTARYDRELGRWFTDDHLARMYEANPFWRDVERLVYGDVLAPDGRPQEPRG